VPRCVGRRDLEQPRRMKRGGVPPSG
jgi:hypothetical protein